MKKQNVCFLWSRMCSFHVALRKQSRTEGLRQHQGCPETGKQVDALTRAAALHTPSPWLGVEKGG